MTMTQTMTLDEFTAKILIPEMERFEMRLRADGIRPPCEIIRDMNEHDAKRRGPSS